MRWYEKAMPSVKDVSPFVLEAAESLRSLKGVKAIRVFGSYAENINNPKYNIKDVDILVECNFESGDLLAIDSGPLSPLNMSQEKMEEEGFDPKCIAFTKECLKLKKMAFDMWVIAKDDVILHWGSMPESVEEWKEIRHQAESAAQTTTGIKRKQICSSSESHRKLWRAIYDETIQRLVANGPLGWYASTADPETILKTSVLI